MGGRQGVQNSRIGRYGSYCHVHLRGYALYCAYFASHSVFPRDLSAKRAKADSYNNWKPAEVQARTTGDDHDDDWRQVWDPITSTRHI